MGGDGFNDIFGENGNDVLRGGGGSNTIAGGAGADLLEGAGYIDMLNGGSGDDRLIGGGGADQLYGNDGSDSFVFLAADKAFDYINDFSAAEGDKLVFEGLLHGTFAYRGSGAFTASGNTEARYDGNLLTVDIDGNGTADIDVIVYGAHGAVTLQASDFAFS